MFVSPFSGAASARVSTVVVHAARRTVSALAVAAALGLAAVGVTAPQATAQSLPTALAPSELDLAALRYFLSTGDETLAAAERDRLRRAFPGVDIDAIVDGLVQGSGVDTGPVWRLIDQSRYEEARSAIATLQADNPAWVPDDNLVEILTMREGQAALDAYLASGDFAAALALGQTVPELFSCERINNPWRLAEAAADTGNPALAVELYGNTARACSDPEHVTATLQKARVHADAETMRVLYEESAQRYPALVPQIAQLASETFSPVLAEGTDTETVAVAAPAAPRASSAAPSPARPAGPGLSRAQNAAARGDAFSCLAALTGNASVGASLQRGWCLHDLGRSADAAAAFRSAEARGSDAQRNEARYGLSIALAAAGQVEAAQRALQGTQLAPERVESATGAVHASAANVAFERQSNREALAHLEKVEENGGGLDRGQLMLKGWALHREGRMAAARRAFREAHRIRPGNDSRLALSQSR